MSELMRGNVKKNIKSKKEDGVEMIGFPATEEELLSNMIRTAKDLKTHFQSKGVHSPEGITRYYEDQGDFLTIEDLERNNFA